MGDALDATLHREIGNVVWEKASINDLLSENAQASSLLANDSPRNAPFMIAIDHWYVWNPSGIDFKRMTLIYVI